MILIWRLKVWVKWSSEPVFRPHLVGNYVCTFLACPLFTIHCTCYTKVNIIGSSEKCSIPFFLPTISAIWFQPFTKYHTRYHILAFAFLPYIFYQASGCYCIEIERRPPRHRHSSLDVSHGLGAYWAVRQAFSTFARPKADLYERPRYIRRQYFLWTSLTYPT
jgi:hypothetical protein